MPQIILVSVRTLPPEERPRNFTWSLWLESMDGRTVIPLTHTDSLGHVLLQSGFLGLGVPPVDLAIGVTPGVPGGSVEDVTVLARDITLPLKVWGNTDAEKWGHIQALRDLTDPEVEMQREGNFKICSATPTGPRELVVAYRGGLEGDMHGQAYSERIVLDLVAPHPYARDRERRTLPFPLSGGGPFLAPAGTDHPWGSLKLSPSTLISNDMPVDMPSAVKVWPEIELDGPAPEGATIIADSGLHLVIDGAIPAGSTLRVVTDPRGRSARLDGVPAWQMISLASRFRPFTRGTNRLDVEVPNASGGATLRLGWRGGYRSMW
ncbi:hypothetical protein NSA53_14905 [Cellulosimicrobium cellulans]|uniref:hypothetical protein n=1 Tax=Cellulosimicrobium cellulans TaxID=1710 RepID=UPI002149B925|nr:hypothetical protein [Cellulosimicrobium cellulans]